MSVVFARPGWMAADRRMFSSDGSRLPTASKIVKCKNMLIGVVGYAHDIHRVVTVVAEQDWSPTVEDLVESISDQDEDSSELLVCTKKELFKVDAFGYAGLIDYPFWAVGSGADFVLGWCRKEYDEQGVPDKPTVIKAIDACSTWRHDVGDGVECCSLQR